MIGSPQFLLGAFLCYIVPMSKSLNLKDYEVYTHEQYMLADGLVRVWENLGRPNDPTSKTGKKLIEAMIDAWEIAFPKESYLRDKERAEYQAAEKSIHEQVKENTGRSLASIPAFIITLMNKFFPNTKKDRKFFMFLVREFPTFRMANKI